MTRNHGTRPRAVASQRAMNPTVEPLESRRLLSGFYSGFSATRPVITPGGIDTLAITGPGFLKVNHLKGGAVGVVLLGTTGASTLTVTQTYQRPHKAASPLDIGSLTINSGVIGTINAGPAELNGPMTPLLGANSLTFGTIGPAAQLDVTGALGSLSVGAVLLGSTGRVQIAGDLHQSLNLGSVSIDGGSFLIGQDLTGTLTIGNLNLSNSGSFVIGHNLGGGLAVTGNLDITSNGVFSVGNDLNGLSVSQAATIDTGGQLTIGEDLTGPLTVGGTLTIGSSAELKIGRDVTSTPTTVGGIAIGGALDLDGGQFTIGEDLAAPLSVNQNLTVDNGGQFKIGRDVTTTSAAVGGIAVGGDLDLDGGTFDVGGNVAVVTITSPPPPVPSPANYIPSATVLYPASNAPNAIDNASLVVNGNLIVSTGGGLNIGGSLNGLYVAGAFEGNGSATPDLSVGGTLYNLVVQGGVPNQGGIEHASITANIVNGFLIPNGIFNTLITAVQNIKYTEMNSDGNDVLYNSQLLAGQSIYDITLDGNVRSTFVANPNSTGYPTRIIAGELPDGTFVPGGTISNLTISGSLNDSVIAASVQPNGGAGLLPPASAYGQVYPTPTNTPGDGGYNTYDAPGGTTYVTPSSGGTPVAVPNWTELSYDVNGKLINKPGGSGSYNSTLDPTIDDFIFYGGSIQNVTIGNVISTNKSDAADFAGIFAAQISGVTVDGVPTPPQ